MDDTPSRIAELLQKYPQSMYCDCLREALLEYYQRRRSGMTRQEATKDVEMERIGKALGISEIPPGRIFPGVRRLDVKVNLSLAKQALVKEALEAASRQGGVELRLSRELENRFLIDRYDGEVTLREFMEYIAGQRQWAPQEDGSYLLRARAKKP